MSKEVEKSCDTCGICKESRPRPIACLHCRWKYKDGDLGTEDNWTPIKEQAPTETDKMICSKCGQMINAEERIIELEAVVSSQAKENEGLKDVAFRWQNAAIDLQQRLDRNTATLITSAEKLKEAVEIIKKLRVCSYTDDCLDCNIKTPTCYTDLRAKAEKFLESLANCNHLVGNGSYWR